MSIARRSHLAPCLLLVWLGASAGVVRAQAIQPDPLPPGWIPPEATGLVAEPSLLRHLINASDGVTRSAADRREGLYPELGNMITGSGWIAAGPGYRRRWLDGRGVVDASADVSWNLYKTIQGRVELRPLAGDRLAVGIQAIYQDSLRVEYFGRGQDSDRMARSAYRLNDTDILGYASVRLRRGLFLDGRVGWIPDPDLSTATGPRLRLPNTLDLFSEASAPGLADQPTFIHGDATVTFDQRDVPGHPTSGGVYRATAATYSDRSYSAYSFQRVEIEGAQFFPLFTRNWVAALHLWQVYSRAPRGSTVPFYMMPSLGGQNTLRGYLDYRYHDDDMQVVNFESRWALFTHVDVAAFFDAGKVARSARDLDFTHMRTSRGVGLRLHNTTSTLMRLDIGRSVEGWRVIVKLSEPFKRSTPATGRSSVMPFVP